ncbi:MAG: hypothetical protein LUI60_03585 [Clostridia bacterium]|nr:hypothetical protein [Clostridia bacterium]
MKKSEEIFGYDLKLTEGKAEIKLIPKENIAPNMQWSVKVVSKVSPSAVTIFESGLCRQTEFSVQINTSGLYLLFYYVVKGNTRYPHARKSFYYCSANSAQSYKEWLASYKDWNKIYKISAANNLPLYYMEYPYQNLALVCSDSEDGLVNKITKNEKNFSSSQTQISELKTFGKWHSYVMSSSQGLLSYNNLLYFSGGGCILNSKIIYGQDDITPDMNFSELLDSTGNFSAVFYNGSAIEFTSDYFGLSPLYKYESQGLYIISNSYHMLLLILKQLGIKLELLPEDIIPYFVTGQRQMFDQLTCHETFVKQVKKVPVHQKFVLDDDGPRFADKSVAEVWQAQTSYTEDSDKQLYEFYKKKIVKELEDNLSVVLHDERFSKVILDVTGGKDSRVILSAMLNVADEEKDIDRIAINSLDVPGKNDKSVFIPLNKLHKFKYRDFDKDISNCRYYDQEKVFRSWFIGQTFNYGMGTGTTVIKGDDMCHVIGAGATLYKSVFELKADKTTSTPDDMAAELLDNYINGILNIDKVGGMVKDIIAKGISEVVGNNIGEMMNNHYFYYRNTYHFGLEYILNSSWSKEYYYAPLYNKNAAKAYHLMGSKLVNKQFEFEILDMLNPMMLKVPFEDPADNKTLDKLKSMPENSFDHRLDGMNLELSYDDTIWAEANKKKIESTNVVASEDDEAIKKDNSQFISQYYDTVLKRLNKVLHSDPVFEEYMGLELYIYLTNNKKLMSSAKMPHDITSIYNKITSLSDIIDIITDY